jgi:adenylate cyclase
VGEGLVGTAVRDSAGESGLTAMLKNEIPLPGLKEPRSQLAVPLRARGRVLGALFVESLHDQYFGYDDEDALMLLGGQFAVAMSLMQPPEPSEVSPPSTGAVAPAAGPPLRLKRFGRDNSVFLDDVYLIRGVAGAILWKLVAEYLRSGRREVTKRELRLAPELRLPDVQDNLEVRLLLLQRRLAEQRAAIQLEKAGRGRMRLNVERPVMLDNEGC